MEVGRAIAGGSGSRAVSSELSCSFFFFWCSRPFLRARFFLGFSLCGIFFFDFPFLLFFLRGPALFIRLGLYRHVDARLPL